MASALCVLSLGACDLVGGDEAPTSEFTGMYTIDMWTAVEQEGCEDQLGTQTLPAARFSVVPFADIAGSGLFTYACNEPDDCADQQDDHLVSGLVPLSFRLDGSDADGWTGTSTGASTSGETCAVFEVTSVLSREGTGQIRRSDRTVTGTLPLVDGKCPEGAVIAQVPEAERCVGTAELLATFEGPVPPLPAE